MAGVCQHLPELLPAQYSSSCPCASLSRMFLQDSPSRASGTESSAHTGRVHEALPQRCWLGVCFQYRSGATGTVRAQFPTRGGERGKNTNTPLTNTPLLNRIAPGNPIAGQEMKQPCYRGNRTPATEAVFPLACVTNNPL